MSAPVSHSKTKSCFSLPFCTIRPDHGGSSEFDIKHRGSVRYILAANTTYHKSSLGVENRPSIVVVLQ